jgi:hypothetical protein
MFRVGFEPTIPAFERAKIFYAIDGAATVIGNEYNHQEEILVHNERTVVAELLSYSKIH